MVSRGYRWDTLSWQRGRGCLGGQGWGVRVVVGGLSAEWVQVGSQEATPQAACFNTIFFFFRGGGDFETIFEVSIGVSID